MCFYNNMFCNQIYNVKYVMCKIEYKMKFFVDNFE